MIELRCARTSMKHATIIAAATLVTVIAALVIVKVSLPPFMSPENNTNTEVTLTVTSPAFSSGGLIPSAYTCEGAGLFPPLSIQNVPAQAASLVLIIDDPDAPGGTFVHYVKFNIPPGDLTIAEGKEPPGIAGVGSSGSREYVGPCPPSGTHRYVFGVYALDATLPLPEGSDKVAVTAAMAHHILATGQLIGLYRRAR